jgi:cobalt-zinc-cadmium resistance protein CzcA
MPPNISDGYIMLKPEAQWPKPKKSRANCWRRYRQPRRSCRAMLRVLAADPAALQRADIGRAQRRGGQALRRRWQVLNDTAARSPPCCKVDGAQEVKVEQTSGLPMLTVEIDRSKTARYGLNVGDVQEAISTAVGGREAGAVFEGDRRFAIVVRLPDALRGDLEAMRRLPCRCRAAAATSFRWAKWRPSAWRRGRTRSAARTASAGW